jgi:hypothetical protein
VKMTFWLVIYSERWWFVVEAIHRAVVVLKVREQSLLMLCILNVSWVGQSLVYVGGGVRTGLSFLSSRIRRTLEHRCIASDDILSPSTRSSKPDLERFSNPPMHC